jgi:hypothetical protein
MKILVLFVVAGLLQAIPKQADKPQSGQNSGHETVVQESSQPATPMSAPGTGKRKNGADDRTQDVPWCQKIIKPLVDSWPLVAVAIWGILVARSTLKAMQDSIPVQRDAARAALLNAQAVINSERAWVKVQAKTERVETDLDSRSGLFGRNGFQLVMYNYGKSPAHILDCKDLKFDFVEQPRDLPIPPQYGAPDRRKKFLAPNDSLPVGSPFKPLVVRVKSDTECRLRGDITSGNKKFVAYGLIEYSDGVSTESRRTAFCYMHDPISPTDEESGYLIPVGPDVYNEYS